MDSEKLPNSMESADEALPSTNEKANFQRLTRLLMCGGGTLLRETFDSIHSPETLPSTLRNPKIQTRLKKSKITSREWNCLPIAKSVRQVHRLRYHSNFQTAPNNLPPQPSSHRMGQPTKQRRPQS